LVFLLLVVVLAERGAWPGALVFDFVALVFLNSVLFGAHNP
jgi:hypothetical protein